MKSLPWAAVWDYYCAEKGVPVGGAWFDEVRQYEDGGALQARRDSAPGRFFVGQVYDLPHYPSPAPPPV